jgi:hypothetical protein
MLRKLADECEKSAPEYVYVVIVKPDGSLDKRGFGAIPTRDAMIGMLFRAATEHMP